MPVSNQKTKRKQSLAESKRQLILDAAREVFASEGLEGASLRAIAAKAGYTPAALYFHFSSKEAIYAELLRLSLTALQTEVVGKLAGLDDPANRFRAAAMAFYHYYAQNAQELDLGFYLFRGGMKPAGLSRETDTELNKALENALRPIADAASDLGVPQRDADLLMVDVFAHAAGLLLLLHTGRIKMFNAAPEALMTVFAESKLREIGRRVST